MIRDEDELKLVLIASVEAMGHMLQQINKLMRLAFIAALSPKEDASTPRVEQCVHTRLPRSSWLK